MSLEEQLNLTRQHFNEPNVCWFEDLMVAIMMAAGAGPSIYNARKAIAEAFRKDPDFQKAYRDNVASLIQTFDTMRYSEPGVIVGPMSSNQINQLADRILDLIFEP